MFRALLLFYLAGEKIEGTEVTQSQSLSIGWMTTISVTISISVYEAQMTKVSVSLVNKQLTQSHAVCPQPLLAGTAAPTWITRRFSECPVLWFTFSCSAVQGFRTSRFWWNMAVTTSVNVRWRSVHHHLVDWRAIGAIHCGLWYTGRAVSPRTVQMSIFRMLNFTLRATGNMARKLSAEKAKSEGSH